MHKTVTISRDVEATMIPAGTPIAIPAGTEVTITQALGGTYTVMGPGIMARIEGKNADALGLAATAEKPKAEATGPVNVDDIWEALKTCYDPEIPVNIVDLGLIYGIRFDSAPGDQQDVAVDMTLTAQGCPAHVQISDQVKARVEQLPGVRQATVNVVWNPPWTPERLSPDARKQLGIE